MKQRHGKTAGEDSGSLLKVALSPEFGVSRLGWNLGICTLNRHFAVQVVGELY